MRRHLANATYGVIDYIAHPLGMLLVAPIVLHKLGASEYGIWMVSTAVISAGGIIASGFSDANIQRIARLRGRGDAELIIHVLRSTLGINTVLGLTLATAAWFASPFAARHIAIGHVTAVRECLICLRIASVLILVRALESVSVSTQRAFEDYRGTVQIGTAIRIATLGAAALLALAGRTMVSILVATAVFLVCGTCMQFLQLRRFVGVIPMWPTFEPEETKALLRLGVFSWLQAMGGVIFGQLDRILLGVSLGAIAVAPYSLCVQFAQPITGLTASGLSFFFPFLAGRAAAHSPSELRRPVLKAFLCNLVLVSTGAALLLLVGDRLIHTWAGAAVAQSAAGILPLIVIGTAMAGLSVTGTYALQALGRFHTVAILSVGSRAATLLVMLYLLGHLGLRGSRRSAARLWSGRADGLCAFTAASRRTRKSLTAFRR